MNASVNTSPRHETIAPRTSPASAARYSRWLLGILLVAAVVLAYQPAWDAGFIWDDDHYVTHNPLLTAPDGLQRIWFSTDSPSQYFPLVYTTFRIEHALWGLNASGYHWVNILLHAINALLVWRLLARLRVPGGWVGAALFALHPVQVESVAWITELKNVQSLFFFLLALLAWIKWVERTDAGGAQVAASCEGSSQPTTAWTWYAAALGCHALALFSKTTACTLPAALVLVLWLQRRRIDARRWAQIAPFVLMGLAMGLVSIWWERNQQGTTGELYAMPLWERVLVASRAIWFYVGKLLWPTNLTFNYPLWDIDAADPAAYAWLVACLGAVAAVLVARRVVGRGLEVGTVFFVAMLSPLLGFVMLYTFKYTFVADHYQYVAVIGPAALLAAGLTRVGERLAKSPWLGRAAAGALVLGLGVMTWRQARMYEDLETLWRATIARNPDSFMAHNNLGAIYLERGEVDPAIRHLRRALEIQPHHGNAHGNLGYALLELGNTDEALAHFTKAVEVEPNSARAHSDLALMLVRNGQREKALEHAQRAVALEPKAAEARNVVSVVHLESGRPAEAVEHAREALRLRPDYLDAHQNAAAGLSAVGQIEAAVPHYERALHLQPSSLDARLRLAQALTQIGRPMDAIAILEQAPRAGREDSRVQTALGLALLQAGQSEAAISHLRAASTAGSGDPHALLPLAIALFQSGRVDEGLQEFERLAKVQPENVDAHFNHGMALLQAGRPAEAIGRFETVVQLQPDLAVAHSNLARAHLQSGQPERAIARYEGFLQRQPDHPHAMSDLAWVLATWPAASIRNGARAIALARKASEVSPVEDPMLLRSLGAALAETGDFPAAVDTARRGAELAEAQGNDGLAVALREHMKRYESGRPMRESSALAPLAP